MYNICIIDDALQNPCVEMKVDDDKPIHESNLKYILGSKGWSEEEIQIKNLIAALLKDPNFTLIGYVGPDVFDEDKSYLPDIIIFDWNFPVQREATEKYLENILKEKFCMIIIYTGWEKRDEIKSIIDRHEFSEFENRIFYFEKLSNSVKKIKATIEKLKKDNFSFRFGKEIREESRKSVEKILVNLGKTDIDQALSTVTTNTRDLIEFIGERFKSYLLAVDFEEFKQKDDKTESKSNKVETDNSNIDGDTSCFKELWKYRLYFSSEDNSVRQGDIIKWNDNNCYLVLTPNCDLTYYWKKTLGFINLIRLLNVDDDIEEIKSMYSSIKRINSDFRTSNIKEVSSLSNRCIPQGSPLFLPFINESDFLLFPKMITSKKIDMPEKILSMTVEERGDKSLTYDSLNNVNKITSLSEPFLTSVVEHIFSELKGYGAPDYNKELKNEFTQKLKGCFGNDS